MEARPLHNEMAFFEANCESFEKKYPNQVLLIKDAELVAVFPTREEASIDGYRRFGQGPFLLKPIGEPGTTATAPALTTGILGPIEVSVGAND